MPGLWRRERERHVLLGVSCDSGDGRNVTACHGHFDIIILHNQPLYI